MDGMVGELGEDAESNGGKAESKNDQDQQDDPAVAQGKATNLPNYPVGVLDPPGTGN